MTIEYTDDPGIDPDKTEESPLPDRDNDDDKGVGNEDPDEITGE